MEICIYWESNKSSFLPCSFEESFANGKVIWQGHFSSLHELCFFIVKKKLPIFSGRLSCVEDNFLFRTWDRFWGRRLEQIRGTQLVLHSIAYGSKIIAFKAAEDRFPNGHRFGCSLLLSPHFGILYSFVVLFIWLTISDCHTTFRIFSSILRKNKL